MYEIFAQLLKEKGITAYKVSKETGIPNTTLSAWKRGISNLKADKIQKIADYLGVSVAYLMGATDIPNEELTLEQAQKQIKDLEAEINEINTKLEDLEKERKQKEEIIRQAEIIMDALRQDDLKEMAIRLHQLTPEQLKAFDLMLEQFENQNK